ncbi:MAG TPA: nitroreductase family deazaflavin-dependent oxidoreductase [Candidatus Saccharimonadales bacterium]|nr:nitroreductase family deazaflavin-dependent oxidoreductase [Candidatus Saccharimonadales bacterium]
MGFNEDLVAQFRKNRGLITEGSFTGRDILVLTTTGAKTGLPRTKPLVYARDGERYLIIASKGGAPTHPAWYHNLRTHSEVTVEVGAETFQAKATAFSRGPERRRLYDIASEANPGFKDYERKTEREIPAILLERLPAAGVPS